MHDQGREFDEIYALTAVRVITASVRDCYGALGVIHSLWKPVPGRFKDFIAMPKVNMYQSLHTTVIGPKGDPVEIQIRTWEMHKIAEEGIAAHWLYKEKKAGKDKLDESLVWLRQLIETQQDMKDPREFMDTVPVDLFPDEVYVFRPKGDVKALPESAPPSWASPGWTLGWLRSVTAGARGTRSSTSWRRPPSWSRRRRRGPARARPRPSRASASAAWTTCWFASPDVAIRSPVTRPSASSPAGEASPSTPATA